MAFGDNGLIRQAELARDLTANSTQYEEASTTNLVAYLNDMLVGTGEDSNFHPIEVDGVPIPDGFYYVGGTKLDGLVISDNMADENKGVSHDVAVNNLVGNQFVWIPVEDDSLFDRYMGYSYGALDTVYTMDICSEPYAGGYTNEEKEYYEMRASVLENDGFYVGRYESGTPSERTEESKLTNDVVIQQGANVYNFVGWNNSETDAMNDEAGGAVELAKGFAKTKGYTSVTSTLIYGVQWDAIMNFIDSKYATENCDANSFVVDSSGKGCYGQVTPAVTGSNGAYAIKNIYDLGGNVIEWTMEAGEARDFTFRITRGRFFSRFRIVFSSFCSPQC